MNIGQWVLSNGRVPAGRGGTPQNPGALAEDARALEIGRGEALRLRLINASLFRYFRLLLTDTKGKTLPLYRIGGESGLLNRTRIEGEGGVEQKMDTQYDRGEIVLGPSERADVAVIAKGDEGDVLTLWTRDFPHTGRGFAAVPTVPVLHLEISEHAAAAPFSLREGGPLLTDPRVDRPSRDLRGRKPTGRLLDPMTIGAGQPGTDDPLIRLTNTVGPSIDDVLGSFEASAVEDFSDVPHLASSRFARVGELLQLEVLNDTQAHHVFHLHGFAFQPLKFRRAGRIVYRFRQPEFVDSINIPPAHNLVFRVLLEDRPIKPNSTLAGGAVGRWLLHCHLFPHSALGTISELVVLPAQ